MRLRSLRLGVMLAASGAGCAAAPAATPRLVSAEAAKRGAEEAGALDQPQAALHLRLAQEQIDKAKVLLANGDRDRADYVLMRAEADSELAQALAKQAKAQADAKAATEEIRQLRRGAP